MGTSGSLVRDLEADANLTNLTEIARGLNDLQDFFSELQTWLNRNARTSKLNTLNIHFAQLIDAPIWLETRTTLRTHVRYRNAMEEKMRSKRGLSHRDMQNLDKDCIKTGDYLKKFAKQLGDVIYAAEHS
jgi:hypothetical protein